MEIKVNQIEIVSATDAHGINQSLLKYSAEGNVMGIEAVLSSGANINAYNGLSLSAASRDNHLEAVRVLLEHGVDVHSREGESLLFAADNGNTKMVKLLIEYGADISIFHHAPLQYAANKGHLETVKLLIEKGADPYKNNKLALRLARKNNNSKVVQYLEDYINKTPRKLFGSSYLKKYRTHPLVIKNINRRNIKPVEGDL